MGDEENDDVVPRSSSLLAVVLVVHLVGFVSFSAGIGSMWGGGGR